MINTKVKYNIVNVFCNISNTGGNQYETIQTKMDPGQAKVSVRGRGQETAEGS